MSPALAASLAQLAAELAPEALQYLVTAGRALATNDLRAARINFREAEIHAGRIAARKAAEAARAVIAAKFPSK